jgi:hypothetical protein
LLKWLLLSAVLALVLSIAERKKVRKFEAARKKLFFSARCQNGQIISVSLSQKSHDMLIGVLTFSRKFEHSKTFGLVTSSSSNAVWTKDEDVPGTERRTGAGRAIVGANEEVLCWDVKKGELLGRWRDADCNAQVTAITQSKSDEDIFAVGYDT